jgi:hypothetical protein
LGDQVPYIALATSGRLVLSVDGNTTDATQEMLQRSFDEVKGYIIQYRYHHQARLKVCIGLYNSSPHQMTFEAFPELHQ